MARDELIYEYDENDVNEIIEAVQGGSAYIALRKVRWNPNSDFKYDLRRYFMKGDGTEMTGKGISLTDEGMENLTATLVEEGFGDTEILVSSLNKREDFLESLARVTEDDTDFIADLNKEYRALNNEARNKPINAKELLGELL